MFQRLEFKRVLSATAFLCLIKSQSTHFKVLTCKTIFCTMSSLQPLLQIAFSIFAVGKSASGEALEMRHAVCNPVFRHKEEEAHAISREPPIGRAMTANRPCNGFPRAAGDNPCPANIPI
jgi:hypothetical protein